MKTIKKLILSSLSAVAVSAVMITGTTFALFTSEAKTDIAITSGKVKVSAFIENLNATSNDEAGKKITEGYQFANGGTVILDENHLNLSKMTPMDKVTFDVVINNESNVAIQYRLVFASASPVDGDGNAIKPDLFDALEISIVDKATATPSTFGTWSRWSPNDNIQQIQLHVEIELPEHVNSDYQDLQTQITLGVEAVQGNANTDNL